MPSLALLKVFKNLVDGNIAYGPFVDFTESIWYCWTGYLFIKA